MREGTWTTLLTPATTAVGLACVMPRVLGVAAPGTATETLGLALLLTGAGGGLLLNRLSRRGGRRMAEQAAALAAERDIRPLTWPDDSLAPLVSAVNACLGHAQSAVADATSEARRVAVELKILSDGREQAEAVLGGIEDAVIVTDCFDEIILANDAAATLFGFTAAEAPGRPVEQVVRDATIVTLIREMRTSRSSSRRITEQQLDVEGAPRHYRLTLACLHDRSAAAGGEPSDRGAGVVCVLRDASREREAALAKNDFVSGVTHELRTPLASIRAYVEMLVDGEVADEKARREYYDIIQTEAARLAALIDNVLNISRIESGLVKIDRKPHSPMMIAERALEVIIPQAKLKNIAVKKELLPAIYQVEADGELLFQVMLNLLSNAVKYTPQGGTVTLRIEADEEKSLIVTKVVDDGAGIPEADLPKLFQKFFRVEKNSKMAKGTGLGLPMVKRVIEQDHPGRVFVTSVEGKGSTFGFELPMHGRAQKQTDAQVRGRAA